jgi:hypothetical protein
MAIARYLWGNPRIGRDMKLRNVGVIALQYNHGNGLAVLNL